MNNPIAADSATRWDFSSRRGRFALASVKLWILWILLTGTLDISELAVGAVVAMLVAWLAERHLSILHGIKLTPRAIGYALAYAAVFLKALLIANIDVAQRVLSPALPIHPAIVRVRTGLKSDFGKLLLTSSITLTPGTLSVDLQDDTITIHWIDSTPGEDLEHATQAIAAEFERYIREFAA